jgi:hypothetical protein
VLQGSGLVQAVAVAEQATLEKGGQALLDKERLLGHFADGWRVARWIPDNTTAAPCCGFTCETCAENPGSKFWCRVTELGLVRCSSLSLPAHVPAAECNVGHPNLANVYLSTYVCMS